MTIDINPVTIFDIQDSISSVGMSPPKSYLDKAPDVVKTLLEKGFFLHGSRSKIWNYIKDEPDWDMSFPIHDRDEQSIINRDIVTELGFVEKEFGEDIEGYGNLDFNLKSYWVHPEHNVTIIRHYNESLFRRIWNSIDPVMFEMFVWKRSQYNRGLTEQEIRDKRKAFFIQAYYFILGVKDTVSLLPKKRKRDYDIGY